MVRLEPFRVHRVPISRLRLDRSNPRLVGQSADATDSKIIAHLYLSADLDELLQSISANGYMDIEPLVVLSEDGKDELVVLEGNRRLAALRLLSDRQLAENIKDEQSVSISVPKIDESLEHTLHDVSAYCVNKREHARSFIGFKHINGAQKWNSYAKARFAANWYKEIGGENLKSIAEMIGDRHATVKRMVSAIYVLDQAHDNDLFDIGKRYAPKFNFSHLYTALARPQYMKYLGISGSWSQYDPKPDPVNSEHFPKLKKLLVWIYGLEHDDKKPVVNSQNPDIKRLGEVLNHAEGLHVLETTSDLDRAHEVTESIDGRFARSLINARKEIRDASGSIRAYDGLDDALLDVAADVRETSDMLYQRMESKSAAAKFEQDGQSNDSLESTD